MGAYQWMIVVMAAIMNLLDGFDVLALAFTATAIRGEFGLTAIELGVGWRVSVFFMSTLCPQDHVSYGWQVSVMIMYAKGGKNEPVFIR